MRLIAVALLTISQFTAFPFLAMVASNSARQGEETRMLRQADYRNVTVIYKTDRSITVETM